MDEINSNALKNLGTLKLFSSFVTVRASCFSNWHKSNAENEEKPCQNHDTRVMAEIMVLLVRFAITILEISLFDSAKTTVETQARL